ncbi:MULTISPECIES: hypothetical protein [unclassified Nocardioides]|uniref:hypothetical protein n=1 Tax=unclassified Nocardioides TaxID=2615069 RepID=UPI00360F7D9C
MAENGTDTRASLLDLLLAKVAEDPYPSGMMMDLIEELLEPDEVAAYAAVLMDKIQDENFPSVSMMRRLVALIQPA